MFSLLDLNVPIVSHNLLSEVNVATVEQGNIAYGSGYAWQDNSSWIYQSTGDHYDIV